MFGLNQQEGRDRINENKKGKKITRGKPRGLGHKRGLEHDQQGEQSDRKTKPKKFQKPRGLETTRSGGKRGSRGYGGGRKEKNTQDWSWWIRPGVEIQTSSDLWKGNGKKPGKYTARTFTFRKKEKCLDGRDSKENRK